MLSRRLVSAPRTRLHKRGLSAAPQKVAKVLEGQIVHSLGLEHLEIIPDGRIGINSAGKILFVSKSPQQKQRSEQEFGYSKAQIENLGDKFLIPGFIDTHAHAPQYVFTGTGTGLPLLEWLEKYTFNYESKFQCVDFASEVYGKYFASEVYGKSVASKLRNGTTTGVYFGTIHLDSNIQLANTIERLGQRAYVGKVNMDRNSPDHYIETTDKSCEDTQSFVEQLIKKDSYKKGLVTPIITPRFVPTCTTDLMKFLGKLADKHSLPIQSHISENKDEVSWVSSLHPECTSYGDVYDKYGLMTDKTIMAHACYLTPEERTLMKRTRAGVSHCPLSNISLNSGFMPLREFLAAGIKVGLGTDVSGGYSPSMLNAMRMAMVAGTVHTVFNQQKPLNYAEAFYLATVGGSELIGSEDKLGNFIVGKEFDALVIDPFVQNSPFDIFSHDKLEPIFDVFSHDKLESIFEKFIFLGDDRNIQRIFVQGKEVKACKDCLFSSFSVSLFSFSLLFSFSFLSLFFTSCFTSLFFFQESFFSFFSLRYFLLFRSFFVLFVRSSVFFCFFFLVFSSRTRSSSALLLFLSNLLFSRTQCTLKK